MDKPLFIDDITVKNSLTGILLRSPVVSGTLQEIRTPKLPNNITLITAADIGPAVCRIGLTNSSGGKKPNQPNKSGQSTHCYEIPVFPEKELSWYGQPVAMLLGPDPNKLRSFAENCTVLADSAFSPPEPAGSVIVEQNYSNGITEAFEKAAKVVEGTYRSGIQDPWPSDPLGVIAIPGPGNAMTIHAAAQWPEHVRSSVAQCLGIKPAMVEVNVSRLEIHLDGRIWPPSLLACQAAAGARKLGKPVKLILKRGEDFLFSPKSVGTEIRIKSALDDKGAILGTKLEVNADFGAFGIFTEEILKRITQSALGLYNHGSVNLETRAIKSTIPPAGPTVGFGLVQGFFAAERHASRIAEAGDYDPADWRKNFFLRKGKKLPLSAETRNLPLEELIHSAETMSDYSRKWASYELLRKNRRKIPFPERKLYDFAWEPLRGIGISLAYQDNSIFDTKPAVAFGAAVVEAEIDLAVYSPRIRGIWLAVEGGTILSEEQSKKSITAASLQALSWAMQEKIMYRDGKIDENRIEDYFVRITDNPPVKVDFLWSKGGPQRIEELPFATIPAAYAQALSQALDYSFTHFPIENEAICAAVQSMETEQ